jgi:hypothetical protein
MCLDSSPARAGIFFQKKIYKRNDLFLHQRRNNEFDSLAYMDDFEANVDVSEDKICAS